MNKYILCVSVSLCLLMSSCLNDGPHRLKPSANPPKDSKQKHRSLLPMTTLKRIHGDCITCSSDIRMIQGKRMKFSVVILNRIT